MKGWYGDKTRHMMASRGIKSSGMKMFRDLNPIEELEFRAYTRENIEEMVEAEKSGRIENFHPVVRDEWGKMKGEASQEAIEYQHWASTQNLSYSEFVEHQDYFKELGEKFNLTEEFEENGII